MLAKAATRKNGYWFSTEHAVDACAFMEAMPHVEGNWSTRTLVLEPWQCFRYCAIFGFRRLMDDGRLVEEVYEEIPRKHGKAEPLENLIPTPAGLKRMGDIEVGDIVFSMDGSPTPVVWASPVWPDRPCLEVEFFSGEKIVVDENHEWLTLPRHMGPRALDKRRPRNEWYGRASKYRVYETKEIQATVTYGGRKDRTHHVPVAQPCQTPDRSYIVHPYVLGAWLGDGNSGTAEITIAEPQIVEEIAACGENIRPRGRASAPYLHIVGSGGASQKARDRSLQARLRKVGVLGDKHVPKDYLVGGTGQRRALLQGMMDTDGSVNISANGSARCEFTTTSPALRDGIAYLLASLGFKATVKSGRAMLNGKDCGPKWRVFFTAYKEDKPFRLERKLAKLHPRPETPTRASHRAVVAVRDAGRKPTRCIEVAHPSHLYLTSESFIPTHNSLSAASIGLYCMVGENENRPLGYIAAATEDQAQKVFAPMKEIVDAEPDLVEQFGIKAMKKDIKIGANRGDIRTIASIGEHNDGHNPHIVVLEELHAQKPDIFEVMRSSFGARQNPLLYQIGTAGRFASGIAWQQRLKSIRILEGTMKADDVFVLIYAADKGDEENCYDEDIWKKINPNWGVSIFPDKVRKFARDAEAQPHRRGEFMRTRLNIWTNAGHRLIEPEAWRACARPRLALRKLRGHRAWVGVDLAKYLDMAAVGILVELEDDLIAGFANFYIPAESPYLKRADLSGMYQSWISEGHVNTTPGGSINISFIEEDVRRLAGLLDVQMIAHDPWQAQQMAKNLEDDGLPVTNYRNNVSHMSDPTYEILARIGTQTFLHDGHPVLEWCAMNVEGDERNDTIFPRKPADNGDEKIDGLVALIMANGVRLNGDTDGGLRENPYEQHSLNREANV